MTTVRTRFAPSPTGYMHVGNVRTALFAWLVARQNKGQFILRIEDTDKVREVAGAEQHIIDSLHWLGLDWGEGVDIGGPFAPYKQSERLDTYQEWGQKLIDKGRAYADPYSAEQVEEFRQQATAEKRPFLYRRHRPSQPPLWDGSQPLRFKSEPKAYHWYDEILGSLSAGEEAIDDFILIKSDGYPTYNFAHIIDDTLMQCTHVIRSQEFLSSVPKYLNLYEALEIDPPIFATPPYVLGPDGKKKLSKRDGAKDVLAYAKEGYLPDAVVNFIATLGWNDGTTQELFSVAELIDKFSLARVQKAGAKFDEARLLWMNGAHIRALPLDELYEKSDGFWPETAQRYGELYRKAVLKLVQERLKILSELPLLTDFFFVDLPRRPELITDHKQLKEIDRLTLADWLAQTMTALEESNFGEEDIVRRLNGLLEQTGQKPAVLFSLIRIATTQAPASPPLAGTLAVLGRDVVMRRLKAEVSALRG